MNNTFTIPLLSPRNLIFFPAVCLPDYVLVRRYSVPPDRPSFLSRETRSCGLQSPESEQLRVTRICNEVENLTLWKKLFQTIPSRYAGTYSRVGTFFGGG